MSSLKFKDIDKFKKELLYQGYSYQAYAHKIGISEGYLSKLLNKKVNPAEKTAKKLAKGINKGIKDIFFTVPVSKW